MPERFLIPWQSNRRSRSFSGRWFHGARHRSQRRLHRRARGHRASRRRQEALRRQGRAQSGPEREWRNRSKPWPSSASTRLRPARCIDKVHDAKLDGTETNKSKLGANAILGISHRRGARRGRLGGVCPCGATSAALNAQRRCPTPLMNILNGGVHADNNGLEIPRVHDRARRARPRSTEAVCAAAPKYLRGLEGRASRSRGWQYVRSATKGASRLRMESNEAKPSKWSVDGRHSASRRLHAGQRRRTSRSTAAASEFFQDGKDVFKYTFDKSARSSGDELVAHLRRSWANDVSHRHQHRRRLLAEDDWDRHGQKLTARTRRPLAARG